MPPSEITGTSVFASASATIGDRRNLRHADARDDARGADGARADADLHRIRARIDQHARGFGRGDVAGDDLHDRPSAP